MTCLAIPGQDGADFGLKRRGGRPLGSGDREGQLQPGAVAVVRCGGSVGQRVNGEVDKVPRLDREVAQVEPGPLRRRAEPALPLGERDRGEAPFGIRSGPAVDRPGNARAGLRVFERSGDGQCSGDRAAPAHHHGMLWSRRDHDFTAFHDQPHRLVGLSDGNRRRLGRLRLEDPAVKRVVKQPVSRPGQRDIPPIAGPLSLFEWSLGTSRPQEMPSRKVGLIAVGVLAGTPRAQVARQRPREWFGGAGHRQ